MTHQPPTAPAALPWRAECKQGSNRDEHGRFWYSYTIFRNSPDTWAVCGSPNYSDDDRAENEANAALIVRAVNAHDGLVLALSWLTGLIVEKPRDAAEQMPLALAAANAALAKARGKE